MVITIIGKLAPNISYKDWSAKLHSLGDVSRISAFNITGGDNKLNNFVRAFAGECGIKVVEWRPNYIDYGDSARLVRNQQMIDSADFLMCFPESKDLKIIKVSNENV